MSEKFKLWYAHYWSDKGMTILDHPAENIYVKVYILQPLELRQQLLKAFEAGQVSHKKNAAKDYLAGLEEQS